MQASKASVALVAALVGVSTSSAIYLVVLMAPLSEMMITSFSDSTGFQRVILCSGP